MLWFGVPRAFAENKALLSMAEEQILKEAVVQQLNNSDQRFRYTYMEKETIEELDSKGQIKKSETKTYLWFHTEYSTFLKLTSLNGAVYDAGYLKTQDEKIRQLMEEDERKSEADKHKAKGKIQQERAEESALFRNLLEAFLFQCEGKETINGYAAWVYQFEPRPGFKPRDRASEILTGLAGKLWITEEEHQPIRLTGTLLTDVDYGAGIFGSLKKGSTLTMEQADIGNGLWFPTFNLITYKANLLIKGTHQRQISQYSEYQLNRSFRRSGIVVESLQ
jgi:hypothetical protein